MIIMSPKQRTPFNKMWLTRVDDAGFESNVNCFNAVIHAFAKPKEGDRAEHWIAEMVRGVRPSENSYHD